MYKVGINFDEISDNLITAIHVMRGCDVRYGELRTVEGKNFVFWDDDEVAAFKAEVDRSGIELVAAATPLFKWYDRPDAEEILHDSFGFNPRIDDDRKRELIDRTLDVATALRISRLRIFSGLGEIDDAGKVFARDPMLAYALDQADKHGIDLYLENEPVCRVYSKAQLADLFEYQKHPRLKLWLDTANLVEIGEEIDDRFLEQVANRLGYVHLKDFTRQGDVRHRHGNGLFYVPVGDGELQFEKILLAIDKLAIEDLIFTVETHAKSHKVEASVRSILATQKLVYALPGNSKSR